MLTPLQILDRRFAEGSITVDEYKERRDGLRESTGSYAPNRLRRPGRRRPAR
jgi:hypothetical protein